MILFLIRAEVAAELAGLRLVEVDDAQLGAATSALEAGSVKLKERYFDLSKGALKVPFSGSWRGRLGSAQLSNKFRVVKCGECENCSRY